MAYTTMRMNTVVKESRITIQHQRVKVKESGFRVKRFTIMTPIKIAVVNIIIVAFSMVLFLVWFCVEPIGLIDD